MSRNSWVSAPGEGTRCFVPETVFQQYPAQDMIYIQAVHLQEGSTIVGAKGQPLTVVSVREETADQLVELIASDTTFTVTPTHRMVNADDVPVLARELEPGQRIMYAAGQYQLQEVRKFSKPEGQQVLAIRVRPDEPFVAFSAPGPILTMGQKKPIRRGGVQRRWGRGASSGTRRSASPPPSIPDTEDDFPE